MKESINSIRVYQTAMARWRLCRTYRFRGGDADVMADQKQCPAAGKFQAT